MGKTAVKSVCPTLITIKARKGMRNKKAYRSALRAKVFKPFTQKNPLKIKNGEKEKVVGAVSKNAA